MFEGRSLQLDWWESNAGCFGEGACIGEVWVSVLGLLVHLWWKEFLKGWGNACGGFVLVDMETKERYHLKWARLLIKSSGKKVPNLLMVVD